MADVKVRRALMFDGDTHGVSISITTDTGQVRTIVLPRHVALMVALEIKRAAEQGEGRP